MNQAVVEQAISKLLNNKEVNLKKYKPSKRANDFFDEEMLLLGEVNSYELDSFNQKPPFRLWLKSKITWIFDKLHLRRRSKIVRKSKTQLERERLQELSVKANTQNKTNDELKISKRLASEIKV